MEILHIPYAISPELRQFFFIWQQSFKSGLLHIVSIPSFVRHTPVLCREITYQQAQSNVLMLCRAYKLFEHNRLQLCCSLHYTAKHFLKVRTIRLSLRLPYYLRIHVQQIRYFWKRSQYPSWSSSEVCKSLGFPSYISSM